MKNKTQLLSAIALCIIFFSNSAFSTVIISTYITESDSSAGYYAESCYNAIINGSNSSCYAEGIYKDEDDNYAIISSSGASAVLDTTLKAETSIAVEQFDEEGILEYINATVAPADEGEFWTLAFEHPEYFTEIDGNLTFDASLYLAENAKDIADIGVYSSASFEDSFTITGGESGTTGTMSLFYSLDGSIENTGLFYDGWSVEGAANGTAALRLIETDSYTNESGTTFTSTVESDTVTLLSEGDYDGLYELTLDFIFGEEFDLTLFLTSTTYIDLAEYGLPTEMEFDSYQIISDFFNTATFEEILIVDSNGLVVNNYGLESSSDFEVFEQDLDSSPGSSVDVPEPSLGIFMIILFATLLLRRKKI